MMTRISIAINSHSRDNSTESKSYSVSFEGEFSKVREEVDKIYDKFKTKKLKVGEKR